MVTQENRQWNAAQPPHNVTEENRPSIPRPHSRCSCLTGAVTEENRLFLLHCLSRLRLLLSNFTLLRFATLDLAADKSRCEVDQLLDFTLLGAFSRAADRGVGKAHYRTISSWRPYHPAADDDVLPRVWNKTYQPEVMAELMDILKRPLDRHYGLPPSGRRYSSCAVVGNSYILLKSDDRASIDGHKIVIRLNNAQIRGYERHVRSKTSLAFVNSNILHLCGRRSCFCHPYGEKVSMVMYICQAIHFLDYAFCNGSHKAPLLVTDARFDLLCTRLVKYYSLKRFMEETGKPPEEWAAAHEERPQEIPFLKDSRLQIPSLVIHQ